MLVYCLTNKIDGKKYVGQTVQSLAKRLEGHRSYAPAHKNSYVHRAIKKHGWVSFEVSILQANKTWVNI